MKKVLMGTTALAVLGMTAGAAQAQEPGKITLGLGGFYEAYVTYTEQDNLKDFSDFTDPQSEDLHEVAVRHSGEVFFQGETTLDNGLTIGFQAELELLTTGDQIDETYMYFTGSWGKVILGAENGAHYLMQNIGPSAGIGYNSPAILPYAIYGATPTTLAYGAANDANKITYFTPRFGGFQFGVSYAPNTDAGGGDFQTVGLRTGNDVGDYRDVFMLGANFTQDFDNWSFAANVGYEHADLEKDTEGDSPFGGIFEDRDIYVAGVNVGFGGFTVGASYMHDDKGLEEKSEYEAYDFGVAYNTGPWTFGLGWVHADDDAAGPVGIPANDKQTKSNLDAITADVGYQAGPGVKFVGGIMYFDEEAEFHDPVTADDRSDNVDGVAFVLGTQLSF